MSDEYQDAITTYREELESLPDQIDFSRLSSNEQLAYWLNLHNVAVIEQIMLNYPLTRVNRQNAYGTNENLFEAKILTVAGVPLSLNDIRLRIVYQQWDDPRVIYGFFNGAIGGPEIARNAFDGGTVWTQLDRNADEFINSLRGVEVAQRELRVSHLYREAERFFPDFETDLRAHLARFANAETATQLAPGRPVRATVEDWHIADLINGSRRCTGSGRGGDHVFRLARPRVRRGRVGYQLLFRAAVQRTRPARRRPGAADRTAPRGPLWRGLHGGHSHRRKRQPYPAGADWRRHVRQPRLTPRDLCP